MCVKMFKPRFAPLVKAGTKLQTVRPIPKRMPKVGDTISLREWSGLPYRSKQRVLRVSIITEVRKVFINAATVVFDCNIATMLKDKSDEDAFARADGFKDFNDLWRWFEETHGPMPFQGILIKWK